MYNSQVSRQKIRVTQNTWLIHKKAKREWQRNKKKKKHHTVQIKSNMKTKDLNTYLSTLNVGKIKCKLMDSIKIQILSE